MTHELVFHSFTHFKTLKGGKIETSDTHTLINKK